MRAMRSLNATLKVARSAPRSSPPCRNVAINSSRCCLLIDLIVDPLAGQRIHDFLSPRPERRPQGRSPGRGLRLEDVASELRPRFHIELPEDLAQVVFDGAR